MPKYSYFDFTPNSDDMNVPGSNSPTKPSEGWAGDFVNDSLRATNSAVRNLGDIAAKLPLDANGNVTNIGPNGGQIGTAAFQNVETFQITGGVLGPNVRGSVGNNVLIMCVCNFSDIGPLYAEQRTRGFDLCDGRDTTNPYPPFNSIRMPNFLGCFPWFTDTQQNTNTFQFGAVAQVPFVTQPVAASNRTVTVGDHNHGNTGPTGLGYSELPNVMTGLTVLGTGNFQDGSGRGIQPVIQGSGSSNGFGHVHNTGNAGNHSFSFNVRPPAIAVLPFLRVW